MSQKPNIRAIGLFVIMAFLLFTATFLIINRGRFFSNSTKNVLYFEGSVKGLNIGSPVVFNGVPIGRVVGISLITDINTMDIQIPVFIEGDKNAFAVLNPDGSKTSDQSHFMKMLIEKGLRARLISQSILTGQMMIDLNFYPGTPAVLHGDGKIQEIPTLPSAIEELSRIFQSIPIRQTVKDLNLLISEMSKLLESLNKDLPPIMKNVKQISSSLTSASQKTDKALDIFADESRTMMDFNKTLKDFGYAAQSIRNWADYLERHPEALLKGKGGRQ